MLDGKQARRTGTSSPLGLIFDHGCDALTTFIFIVGFGSIIRLDSSLWFGILWLMAAFPFFLNTWEEYYTGELNLPIIHGVSEGTLLASSSMFIAGLNSDFWIQTLEIAGYKIQYNHLWVGFGFLLGIYTSLICVQHVLQRFKDQRNGAIVNLLIFLFLVTSLMAVILLADSYIIKNYPKIIVLVYGFAFAKLVGHLQLAHLADAKFLQYRKSLLTSFVVLFTVSILDYFKMNTFISIDYLIILFLILHIIGR